MTMRPVSPEARRIADGLQFTCRLPGKKPDFTACGGPAAEAYWEYFTPARITSLLDALEAAEAKLAEVREVNSTYFTVHGNSTAAALQSARDLAEGTRQVLDREPLGGTQERSDEKESP